MADERNDGTAEIEAPITINIGNLCKGAIIDAFEKELQKWLKKALPEGAVVIA